MKTHEPGRNPVRRNDGGRCDSGHDTTERQECPANLARDNLGSFRKNACRAGSHEV